MTKFTKWWHKWSPFWVLLVVPVSIERPQLQYGDNRPAGEEFLREVFYQVENFVQALRKEDPIDWQKLCSSKQKVQFRYLGSYTTAFTCAEWKKLLTEQKKRWWGRHDGSGEPITGTFREVWFDRLQQIAKKYQVWGINKFVKQGNAINQKMGNAPFIDLTWSGPKKYGEMGWESLRLFFERSGDQWFLKGLDIYHWTI